jgi:hypothetical protein
LTKYIKHNVLRLAVRYVIYIYIYIYIYDVSRLRVSELGGGKWRVSGHGLFAARKDPTVPPEQQGEWAQSACIRLERNLLSLLSAPHVCL